MGSDGCRLSAEDLDGGTPLSDELGIAGEPSASLEGVDGGAVIDRPDGKSEFAEGPFRSGFTQEADD
jgi:hypothetical protein